jgi:ATP-dependent Clp protease ATP-binding subunit ClpA
LLGAPPGYVGYEEGGQLTNQVKKNPFSVLLFDEIEKAHPTILDKFLQILEDGRMTDGRGDTVYFSESIIIFTSNVGIYQLDQNTGRPLVNPLTGQPKLQIDPNVDTEYESVKDKMTEGVSNYFKHVLGRPELLNRIGQNIVVFDFVRLPMLRKILEDKTLKSISAQIREKWKVDVLFSTDVIDDVMEIVGTDISAGGRGMGNLAEKVILNPLARILFELIGKNVELTGKTMNISRLIAPATQEINRYELEWELL